jgi:uncharacterized cupin superfamily protein
MFKPAMAISDLPEQRGSGYPEPFKSRMGDRTKAKLGDAFGLTQFGVNHVTLGPGGMSALRHFHSHEDELLVMLEGELVLVTNLGEQVVTAGMCVGFKANAANGHHMVNRSAAPARYIEVGSRVAADVAFYPDDDLCWVDDGKGTFVTAHKDGEAY